MPRWKTTRCRADTASRSKREHTRYDPRRTRAHYDPVGRERDRVRNDRRHFTGSDNVMDTEDGST